MVPQGRLFASPARYVQGPGVLETLGSQLSRFGSRPILVVDAAVRDLIGDRVLASCAQDGLEALLVEATGEITYAAVAELAERCSSEDVSVVVGLGGGKVLDTAKALSGHLRVPVVTVPTIASNDSPTSSAIAMYDDEHHLVAVDMLPANPALVLVDTQLIASAPASFLRSGIGDAVAKVFEAEGCARGTGVTPLGTRPLGMALAIGRACFDTLWADAVQALADCEAGRVSEPLERVVEAVILMSGLAFENGGLSLAHSLTRGLMRVDGARTLMHGYHVGWGALVQVVAEGRPDEEVRQLVDFLTSVGLPVSSADLALAEPWRDQHAVIAEATMTAPHLANLPMRISSEDIMGAIAEVDRLAGLRSS
ncbi:MAG: glycerol dehydrogenase [Actinomycetota bacterium]|jgi:glycerol dehydrogenase|nr:glycerol dehydrogenase [Actinomycetota bacterium]